tara:strand:+ start:4112 stop:5845 length:1734 start_codon:yes stop_codon:yes gene_type:complete
MKSELKFFRKADLILVLTLIVIFFVLNKNIIDYGLPFFAQEDENAFLKGTLSYISFITGIKRELSDPFLGPLMNLFLTLKLLFINEIILNLTSISDLKLKAYSDPSILIIYGRYCSLIVTSFCLFILYLILKKLKINFLVYFPLLISLSFSLFTISISLVNGKNSYYLLFFLSQLYFFIKYYNKIEKFNKNSYFILAFLGALAWGINYWSSIVSIYGIIILHLKKFNFKNTHYLIIFVLIFTLIGVIPGLFLEDNFFLKYLVKTYQTENFIKFFFNDFFKKFLSSFQIILNTEVFVYIFLILFVVSLASQLKNKRLVIVFSFLILEPLMIFAISGEEAIPQIRYFSGSICLIFILTALIIQDFLKKISPKIIIVLFLIINAGIILDKTQIYFKINKLVKENHSFVDFYNKNNFINTKTLYLIPTLDTRKNFDNLNFYKALHEKKIIENILFEKDNYLSIIKKIEKDRNSQLKFKNSKTINLHVFNINLFKINNLDNFFLQAKENYEYVSIQENGYNDLDLYNYIRKNFQKIYVQSDIPNLNYNNGLRDIIRYIYKGNDIKDLDNFILGNNYSLYKLN